MAVELKATHWQRALLLIIALALVEAAAPDQAQPGAAELTNQALPGCMDTCGNVSIPYPFGVGISSQTSKPCFLEEAFNFTCNSSTLYYGNVEISNITLEGQMDMLFFVSSVCYEGGSGQVQTDGNETSLSTPSFAISSEENNFISVGCDTYGYLNSFYEGTEYSTGCLTRCDSRPQIPLTQNDGHCSGIGCCQVDIPPGMKNITLQAFSYDNFNDSIGFNNCSYSFVAKRGFYKFNTSHLQNLPFQQAPLVADWTVGNNTCEESRGTPEFACRNNSDCVEAGTGYGYRCRCNKGFRGNPYHPNGCTDVDECKTSKHNCISEQNCRNTGGSHECFCLKGESGNATKGGEGCHPNQRGDELFKFVVSGAGFLLLFVMGMSWLYVIYQKRKLIKLKEKFFRQNGGDILKQKLKESSLTTEIFTENELKKATNNYDDGLISGGGSYGTVFKGILADNRIVAVKKSKAVDRSQIEQFVNEVVVLSQINHRNVVKLLGCCLETEVPLLVYEFVNNGTLFNYLHNKRKATNVSWTTRLRIAAEVAGALSYLHSAASIPIIHRDVKSANILLDDTYTAKVSDFGASKLVPLDKTELATMVQGTIGYLDPEYIQTSQLTQKSDVYSFGVVLVELLTGEKAFSFERLEEKRSLAVYFLSCLKEGRLFEVLEIGILNEENEEEIKEVAVLATKCLGLKGEERPSMKELAIELEGIRMREKHLWTKTDINLEETQYTLPEAAGTYEHGDSSGHKNIVYDSITDHVPVAFEGGR